MRIVAFRPDYNDKLANVVEHLAKGIPGCEVVPMGEYVECDIAIIFGAYKNTYKPTLPKKDIMEKHRDRQLLMIESGFVKRGEYYQVGWGGYAGNADFNNDNSPSDRWDKLNIKNKPWKKKGDYYVVMGQVPWDTQVQDVDHKKWCRTMITRLSEMGERVIFRPHPRIQYASEYLIDEGYTTKQDFSSLMEGAKAVVTWNSTSSLDAILHGVPVITYHPSSICYDIGVNSIYKNLRYPDRTQFLNNLGYSMWTLKEMASGETWEHLTR